MSKESSVAIVGAGSWGTALAILLAKNGKKVFLWGHNKEHIKNIIEKRENKKYLRGFPLHRNIHPTFYLDDCVKKSQIIILAIPSHTFRSVLLEVWPFLGKDVRILSATKGIENSTFSTMSGIIEEIQSNKREKRGIEIGVISGPSFALEVAQSLPTAVTIGFKKIEIAQEIQKVFVNESFRVYTSTDLIGLEISGALKNIIAIAAGISDGLGFGQNSRAALITRGLAEIKRLGIRLQAQDSTFSGLSGLGDLVLTCTGDLSRNRTVGLKLGIGMSLEAILDEMHMVAEGIKTTHSVFNFAKELKIEMPITEQIYNILYENKDCSTAVKDLLTRELKSE